MLTSTVHIAVITAAYSNQPFLLHVRSSIRILTRDTPFASNGQVPMDHLLAQMFVHTTQKT